MTPISTANERLEATRERMRLAMLPPPEPEVPVRRRAAVAADNLVHTLVDKARRLPVVADVNDSVLAWWQNHPLRPLGQVAGEASDAALRPVARRHPWTLVLGAAAAGALLAWGRPYRLILRSALFAGLLPQLATRVVSHMPIESWVRMATAAMQSGTGRRAGSRPVRRRLVVEDVAVEGAPRRASGERVVRERVVI